MHTSRHSTAFNPHNNATWKFSEISRRQRRTPLDFVLDFPGRSFEFSGFWSSTVHVELVVDQGRIDPLEKEIPIGKTIIFRGSVRAATPQGVGPQAANQALRAMAIARGWGSTPVRLGQRGGTGRFSEKGRHAKFQNTWRTFETGDSSGISELPKDSFWIFCWLLGGVRYTQKLVETTSYLQFDSWGRWWSKAMIFGF